MRIKATLFLLLKFCLFSLLATVSLYAHAEYYLVYSTPDFYNLCTNCQSVHHSHKHKKVAKTQYVVNKRIRHVSHHGRGGGGLYVYYPARRSCPCNNSWTLDVCQCCPQPNRVHSQWGDYVVFSSRPADRTYGVEQEEESSYNPDLSTADDGGADLEIN